MAGFVLLALMLGLLCPPKYGAALLALLAAANMNVLPLIPIRGGVVLALPVAAVAMAGGMIAKGGHRVRIQPDWIKLWGFGLTIVALVGIAITQFGQTASNLSATIELSQPFTVPFCAGFLFTIALSQDGIWKVAGAVMFAALTLNAALRIGVFALGDPPSLVMRIFHPTLLRTIAGEPYDLAAPAGDIRIVAPFTRMLPWAWTISLAAVFVAGAKWRRPCLALLVLFSLNIYLSYTRAMYIGLIITAVFAVVFAARFIDRDTPLASVNIRRMRSAAVVAGATLVAAAVATSSSAGPNRLAQVFAIGTGNDRTTTIRLKALDGLLSYMNGIDDWLFGSGFLSANAVGSRTVAAFGGFYNSDLGLIAVLMPLGLVGVVLLTVGLAGLVRSSMNGLRAVRLIRSRDLVVLKTALAGSALYFVFFLAVSTSLFLPQTVTLGVALAFAISIAAISEANQLGLETPIDSRSGAGVGRTEPQSV